MKNQQCQRSAAGFTLVELLCVMAIIGLLAALLLPALTLGKDRAKRIVCVNNERETGLAFQMFLHDHNSKLPMEVPMSDGGTEEFAQNGLALGGQFYFSYRHFQVLSNYSERTEELVCPADDRAVAANMGRLQNANLSYFVAINASYNQPESILAGDRNITVKSAETPTIQNFEPGSRLHWTREMHQYKGDILFADGHVEFWNQVNLTADLRGRRKPAIFFLPSVTETPAGGGYNRSSSPPPSSPASSDRGDANPAPNPQPAGPGNTGHASPPPPNPNPTTTMEKPPVSTPEVIPLPAADVSGMAQSTPTGAGDTAMNGSTTGENGGGFQAFTKSGWWFWLCLLLALGLAETGRRLLKNRQAQAEEDETT